VKKVSFRYICTVLLLGATLGAYALTERRPPEFLAMPLDTIDKQIAGWSMTGDEPLTQGVLGRLQLTSYVSRIYQKGGTKLGMFVAYYAQQRAGESMHSPKHCLPGSGWEIWKHGSALVPVNGRQIEINQYSIQNSGQRLLVFYWYQSRERILSSEYMGKILLAKDALLTGHTAGSLVRVTLPDVPAAPEEGVAFASVLIPAMQRCLGAAN
jgi:EpsI family protein